MKRIVFLLLCVIGISPFFGWISHRAQAEGLGVTARAAYLTEAESGAVIYEKNSKTRYPIASMVKIMTALLVFEELDKGTLRLDEMITISGEAAGMGGSQMFIEEGDIYTVSDLLKGIIVVSANDASVQMAERIAGSEEEFTVKMNNRARELGMVNTHFSNCTGLPAPENYSSAEDVAKMTRELIKHKEYYNYSTIWIENYTHPDGRVTEFVNTNKLIRFYKGCDSGKTGFTDEAMFCLSASAKRNGMRAIAVVMGAESSKTRFAEASKLLNSAFAQYENKLVADMDNPEIAPVAVRGGKCDTLPVKLDKSVYYLVKKGEKVNLTVEVNINTGICAPIKAGDKVGTLSVLNNGINVGGADIIAAAGVDKASYWDYVKKGAVNW